MRAGHEADSHGGFGLSARSTSAANGSCTRVRQCIATAIALAFVPACILTDCPFEREEVVVVCPNPLNLLVACTETLPCTSEGVDHGTCEANSCRFGYVSISSGNVTFTIPLEGIADQLSSLPDLVVAVYAGTEPPPPFEVRIDDELVSPENNAFRVPKSAKHITIHIMHTPGTQAFQLDPVLHNLACYRAHPPRASVCG